MVELAEDEMRNFGKVWAAVFVSLSYCYTVGKLTPKGFTRLFVILPIVFLFLILPLHLTSLHLGGTTAFFISWLANFKLLLFAFDKGPLCNNPSISFPFFLALACLPIKPQQDPPLKPPQKSQNNTNPYHKSQNKTHPSPQNHQKPENNTNPDQESKNKTHPSPENPKRSLWHYIIKITLLLVIINLYEHCDSIHPKLVWFLICFHIYFALEIILALFAKSAEYFLGCELEPQFNEPLLSTSLQDFWGRRWNIMVTRILRPTVYVPTLGFSAHVVGRKWAPLPATMATFVVSAIMHELIFYYLGRVRPTFETTWFFLLHGFSLCLEIVAKKAVGGKCRVPRWLSGPLTLSYVVATGFWLFLPPLLRAGLVSRGLQEYAAFSRFSVRLIRAPIEMIQR